MAAVVAQFILQGVSRVGAVVKSYAFRLTICKVSHHPSSRSSVNSVVSIQNQHKSLLAPSNEVVFLGPV